MEEEMTCTLCQQTIGESEGHTSFNYNFVEEDDPLWPFRKSVMHHDCFQGWDLRLAYVKKFNETIGKVEYGGKFHHMNEDGLIEKKDFPVQ